MPSWSWRALGRTMSSGCVKPERDEQQSRLVDVAVVLIDDRDRGLAGRVGTSEPVGCQRPAGSAAQDHDAIRHTSS